MTAKRTCLLALFPEIHEEARRVLILNAVILARWMPFELQLAASAQDALIIRGELSTIQRTVSAPGVIPIHPLSGDFSAGLLALLRAREIDLLLAPFSSSHLGPVLESCPTPVLLIPSRLLEAKLPIEWILVPVSAEQTTNEALRIGIQLGSTKSLPVDILHVSSLAESGEENLTPLELLDDQFHHEYPQMVEQVIAEASPYSTIRERRCIRDYCHRTGDVPSSVLEMMSRAQNGLLILEWNGVLLQGRAERLKEILRRSEVPVLLTQQRFSTHQAWQSN
ncbi:MAG: hypothetical protein ACXWP5_08850 [Bdellovibrionota bacterium]